MHNGKICLNIILLTREIHIHIRIRIRIHTHTHTHTRKVKLFQYWV
jgi:hypothetical protein